MNKGDFIEVKQGTLEPEYGKYDLSGWRGKVVNLYEYEGENLIEISWSIETIKKMPIEFIQSSIEDGCSFSEMNLSEAVVLNISDMDGGDEKEREKLIMEMEQKYEDFGYDDDEKRVAEILGGGDIYVNEKNLTKYRKYLIDNLKGRILLTGIEDFPWEERFMFGYGSEEEHKELRKINPSSLDTFKLVKILQVEERSRDLVARVSRKSDLKKFNIPLSWLECTDDDSMSYSLLNDFSVWVVNC